VELKNSGDRYALLGAVKGSTILVHPRQVTLMVTSNPAIEDCFGRQEERAGGVGDG
jgi:hypothetical protein